MELSLSHVYGNAFICAVLMNTMYLEMGGHIVVIVRDFGSRYIVYFDNNGMVPFHNFNLVIC